MFQAWVQPLFSYAHEESYMLSRTAVTKCTQTRKCETTEIYPLRSKVWNQGVDRVASFGTLWGRDRLLPLLRRQEAAKSLALLGLWRHYFNLYVRPHNAFFSVSLCVFSLSCNDIPIGPKTHPNPVGRLMREEPHCHPYYNYFCKDPISKSVIFWGSG